MLKRYAKFAMESEKKQQRDGGYRREERAGKMKMQARCDVSARQQREQHEIRMDLSVLSGG